MENKLTEESLENKKILLVDDSEENVYLLKLITEERGYKTVEASGGQEALDLIGFSGAGIDLIILDIMMPGIDGLEVTRRLKSNANTAHIPIILLTAKKVEHGDIAAGLDLGADDFLTKPVSAIELLARVRSLLRMKSAHDQLAEVNENLEQLVEERTIELLSAREAAIFGFARLAEKRDPETGGHLERIRSYTQMLARELKNHQRFSSTIDDDFISGIYFTSPLHDIGKVGIPDNVLLKPGKLTADEFEIMKTHSLIGQSALLSAEARSVGGDDSLRMGADIAGYHHEKWDGSGYPTGIKGDDIPVSARIMALADVYDALVSKRVYKEAFTHEKAASIIVEGAASHFDPDIVVAFQTLENKFRATRDRYNDEGV